MMKPPQSRSKMKKRKKSSSKVSFAQAARALGAQPKEFEDPEAMDQGARLEEFNEYDEDDAIFQQGSSSLRRSQAAPVELGERYQGKVTRRAKLMRDDDDEDEDDESSSGEEGEKAAMNAKLREQLRKAMEDEAPSSDEEEEENMNDYDDDDDDDDSQSYDDNEGEEEEDEDESSDDGEEQDQQMQQLKAEMARIASEDEGRLFKSKDDTVAEHDKAQHVRHQKALWEHFLNFRIRLQPSLSLANRLPQTAEIKQEFEQENKEIRTAYKRVIREAKGLMQDMLLLQAAFAEHTKDVPEPNQPDNDSADAVWAVIQDQYADFSTYKEENIDKWSKRVQLASGAGAADGTQFKAINQSLNQQIENVLEDRPRLIRRTQLKRTDYEVFGKKRKVSAEEKSATASRFALEEYDEEVFDDTDFYQMLLREIISGNSEVDVNMRREARKVKLKSRVDRRASKGRKIRYTVQEKLVSFMAPVIRHDDSFVVDELFAGLFGKKVLHHKNKK